MQQAISRRFLGWITVSCCAFALLFPNPLSAEESGERVVFPSTASPYQVLRSPEDLRIDRHTSVEQDRPLTPVIPKQRRTYAYGWFGVSPRTHQHLRSDMYNQRTSWSFH